MDWKDVSYYCYVQFHNSLTSYLEPNHFPVVLFITTITQGGCTCNSVSLDLSEVAYMWYRPSFKKHSIVTMWFAGNYD